MKILYVINEKQEIIGEVTYQSFPTFRHLAAFREEIAKSYGVLPEQVKTQHNYEKLMASKGIYFCTICRKNPVNVEAGIDTCDECIKIMNS